METEAREFNPTLQQQKKQIHYESADLFEKNNNDKSDVCSDITNSSHGGSSSDSDSESHNSASTVFSTPLPSDKKTPEHDGEKKKLKEAEDEIYKLKSKLEETEAALTKMATLEIQLLSAENSIRLQGEELEKENTNSLMLQRQIVELEAKLECEKKQVQDLEERNTSLKQEIMDRDSELKKLNVEIQDTSGAFAIEKWQLESSVITLSQNVNFLELREHELQTERDSLAGTIMQYETEKLEAERSQSALEIEKKQLEEKINTKDELVHALNAENDALKLKNDALESEKHDLEASIQDLHDEIGLLEDQIHEMENNLQELHREKQLLITESDQADKLVCGLKYRVEILEKEVAKQAVMISDTAEGKREAIRQLCFSLDHFRSAYEEIRNMYGLIKKPTALICN